MGTVDRLSSLTINYIQSLIGLVLPVKFLGLGLYWLSLSQPGPRPRAVSLTSHNIKLQCAIPRKVECWEEFTRGTWEEYTHGGLVCGECPQATKLGVHWVLAPQNP